jgi:hypothetical protein
MHCSLFKGARSSVTVQALAIVVGIVESQRRLSLAEVLHIDVPQTPNLGADRSVHDVIGVAGIAGLIARDARILKMGGGDVAGIVNMQAASVRFHDVAGKTKLCVCRPLHMLGGPQGSSHHRKQKQGDKRELLATPAGRDGRPDDDGRDQKDRNRDQQVKQRGRREQDLFSVKITDYFLPAASRIYATSPLISDSFSDFS